MNSPDESSVPSTHHSESRSCAGGITAFCSESRGFKPRIKGSCSEVRLSFSPSQLINAVKCLKLGLWHKFFFPRTNHVVIHKSIYHQALFNLLLNLSIQKRRELVFLSVAAITHQEIEMGIWNFRSGFRMIMVSATPHLFKICRCDRGVSPI
jgi:hypothetical protein